MGLVDEIASIVGADNVSNKPFVLWTYSKDASVVEGGIPSIVVLPKITEEVQAIMKLANGTKTPIFPRGSGTSLWGAVPTEGTIVIDMARMNEVIKIDEEVLTCVTKPGITFGELDAILNRSGYRFLVGPENSMSGTIGGHFASHGTGIGSATYGFQGECVLGLKVVLPDGQLLATGSSAHPFNPRHYTAYAFANDLTGLFCGSEGTLGTIVEIALKIERLPEAMEFLAFRFNTFESACEAAMILRRERIPLIQLSLRHNKFLDVVDPKGKPHDQIRGYFGIEGDRDLIGIYRRKLMKIAQKYGEYIGDEPSKAFWVDRWRTPGAIYTLGVRAMIPFLFPHGKEAGIICNKIVELCDALEEKYGLHVFFVGGFGVDRGWLLVSNITYDESDPTEWEKVKQAFREMQDKVYQLGVYPYRIGTYWSEYICKLGPYYDVLKRIKEALDPNHIMAPRILGL
jgi:glycolate oxidase